MKKKLVLSVFTGVALLSLAGCSGDSSKKKETTKTSEKVEQTSSSKKETKTSSTKEAQQTNQSSDDDFDLMIEAAQSQISNIKEQAGSTYKDITIEKGEGHTVVYNYTFAQDPGEGFDMEALKPTLVKAMKPAIDGSKGMFPDIKLSVNYLKPDGSTLAHYDITQEDTDKVESESTQQ